MKRSIVMVCAVFLMAGSCTAPVKGHVVYRITGTSKSVKLISIWLGNKECQYADPYLNLPWVYEFDGVADLHLGLSASKWDTGSMHLSIHVNGERLALDSVPCADVGGSVEVSAQWP